MSASEPRDAGGTMRVPRFVEILSGLRLLSVEDLAAVQQAWADRATVDAQLLAKDLVQQDKLTRYQAAAIYQNKTRGLVLNDYVVLDKLGSGGMGNVYKARHRNSGDTVAIKVMSSASMRSPDNVKRFQREAEMAARLNHPNIVRGIEAGSADGLHYFAMEFVDGLDLSNYLKKQGPIPYQQALQCITQAALGLDFAHAQGVVHRDIKPGNLFLCKDGTIKLLDLGLARLSDPSETATAAAHEGLTQTGQVMGTVDYMAPEQALNTRHADARSDIYSLGCALYRLITGEIPFDGQSMVEKILAHREQPVPSVRAKFAEVPLGVDLVLSRMLAKRPDDRYQTMREVAQALQNAPTMTESVGVLPTPAASGAVAPGASIVPAAMPVAVSIPIALTIPQAVPEPSNSFSFGASVAPVGRESSRIKPRSKAGWLWGSLAVGVVMLGAVAHFLLNNAPKQIAKIDAVPNPPMAGPTTDIQQPSAVAKSSPPPVVSPSPIVVPPAPKNDSPSPTIEAVSKSAPQPAMVNKKPAPQPANSNTANPPISTPAASIAAPTAAPTTTSARIFEPTTPFPAYRKTLAAVSPPPFPDNLAKLTPDEELALAERIHRDTGTTVYFRNPNGSVGTYGPRANLTGIEFHIIHVELAPHRPIATDIWPDLLRLSKLTSIRMMDTTFSDGHLEQLCRANPQLTAINMYNCEVTAAGLSHLQQLPQLYEVTISDRVLTDEGAEQLARCRPLAQLYLSRMTLSEAAVQKLIAMPNLRHFRLTETSLDDDAVKNLRASQTLETFWTTNANVTASGRARLLQNHFGLCSAFGYSPPLSVKHPFKSPVVRPGVGPIAPDVAAVEREVAAYFRAKKVALRVDVAASAPGDQTSTELPSNPFIVTEVTLKQDTCTLADFAQLQRLTGLRVIAARDCPINDDTLQLIATIGSLRGLNLQGTAITNAGVKYLGKLRSLELLSLQRTPVTDAVVEELRSWQSLKWLNLAETKLTSAGAKQFLTASDKLETVVLAGMPLDAQVFLQADNVVKTRMFDIRGTGLDPNKVLDFARSTRNYNVEFMHDVGFISAHGIRSLKAPSAASVPTAQTAATTPTAPATIPRPVIAATTPPAEKFRVDAAALTKAREETRTRLRTELAEARKPNSDAALAKLVEQATTFSGEPAAHLALVSEVRDAAAETAATSQLLALYEYVGPRFELDAAKWVAEGLDATAGKSLGITPSETLATAARDLAEQLIFKRDMTAGRTLLDAALGVARRNNRTALVRELGERRTEVETLARAIETLAKTPDASIPNTTLARQTCFVEQDWPATFAHLAKSSDAAIKEAAEASLAKPTTAEEQLRVADLWWNRAEKASNSNSGPVLGKEELQFIARYWYQPSANGVTGLNKIKADKRLHETAELHLKFAKLVRFVPPGASRFIVPANNKTKTAATPAPTTKPAPNPTPTPPAPAASTSANGIRIAPQQQRLTPPGPVGGGSRGNPIPPSDPPVVHRPLSSQTVFVLRNAIDKKTWQRQIEDYSNSRTTPLDGTWEQPVLLVGMEVALAPIFTDKYYVNAIRPIFLQASGRTINGQWLGEPTTEIRRLEAKAGYAVAAMTVYTGLYTDAVKLIYAKIDATQLDIEDTYESVPFGGTGNAARPILTGEGRFIVGVTTHTSNTRAYRLGLLSVSP